MGRVTAFRSGFCGRDLPPESHARCRVEHDGKPCVCDCHTPADQPAPPETPKAGVEIPEAGPLVITEPCVLPDLDENAYHADPVPASHGKSLSHSGARTLLDKSPAHYLWERTHPVHRDVFDFGSAAHLRALGEGPEIVVVQRTAKDGTKSDAEDWRSPSTGEHRDEIRAHGKIPLLRKDLVRVDAMADKLREHPVAGRLFVPGNGHAEVSLFWQDTDTGVFRRARLDWLRTEGRPICVDYKTSANAHPARFGKHAADYGYFSQDPWYRDAVWAHDLAGPDLAFVFVVQEKDPPYAVSVVQLDDEAARIGRSYNRRALELYAECQGTGIWPSYPTDISPASLPPWFVRAQDERYTA